MLAISATLSLSFSFFLSLTGEQDAHTLFTGQRETERDTERKRVKEREKRRESKREKKREGEREKK